MLLKEAGIMIDKGITCREGSDLPEASMRLRCPGDGAAIVRSMASRRSWMAGSLLAERSRS